MADLTVGRVAFGPTNGPALKVNVDRPVVRTPKPIRWMPKADITTYELAQAIPVLLMIGGNASCLGIEDQVAGLPDEVKRHFVVG